MSDNTKGQIRKYLKTLYLIGSKIVSLSQDIDSIIKGFYADDKLDKDELNGIANMGIRPTVGGELPVLEIHLLDFSQSIYGKTLTVEFLKKVRDEKKFENINALKEQIFKDIFTAKKYFV